MSYRLDHKALEAYAREVGVELPIKFRRTGSRAASWGTHWFYTNGILPFRFCHHSIAVEGANRPPEDVARTIAHELKHALQAEDAERGGPGGWGELCRQQRRDYPDSDDRPIEIEANEFADEHAGAILRRCIRIRKER